MLFYMSTSIHDVLVYIIFGMENTPVFTENVSGIVFIGIFIVLSICIEFIIS